MPAQISWSVGEFVIPGVLLNGSFSEGFPVVTMVFAHVSAAGSGSQSPSAQRGTRLTGERGSVSVPTSPTTRVATWELMLVMIQDSLRKRSEFWAVTGKGGHAVCLGDFRNSFVHHLQHLKQLDWKHFCPSLGWNCNLTFVPPPISKQVLARELLKGHRHCSPSAAEQQSISY